MLPRPSGIVTLLTDFGLADPYVGVMKGALLRASAKLVLVDLGHEVPPQDVVAGAFFAAAAVGRFPTGTVHVAVVDPGVGTDRRLLAAAAHDCYWLAPDNGLLGAVLAGVREPEVRALDVGHLGLVPESRTFHGRDLLAPVAGWLASGRYGFTALGPRIADALPGEPWAGGPPRVVHVDHYGNLVGNVGAAAAAGVGAVRVGGRLAPLCQTYADVAPGELLAYVGSFGLLEVAQRGGHAARLLGVGRGESMELVPA